MPAADKRTRFFSRQRGYTLIELVIGIAVFGTAMVLLSTTLFPMFGKSANPHFEARAAALGQAVMNQILARPFDTHSDPNGSRWRCDEDYAAVTAQGILAPNPIPACSSPLKAQTGFNAVEDYIGCWGEVAACRQPYRGAISELTGGDTRDYPGFSVDISVAYDNSVFNDASNNPKLYKRIDLRVDTGHVGHFDFSAYRSNY